MSGLRRRREAELNSAEALRTAMERLGKSHLVYMEDNYFSFLSMSKMKGRLADGNIEFSIIHEMESAISNMCI